MGIIDIQEAISNRSTPFHVWEKIPIAGIFPGTFSRSGVHSTRTPGMLKDGTDGLYESKCRMRDGIFVMGDQFKFDSGSEGDENGSSRSSPYLSDIQESSDVNRRYVDITAMIRSLQRTEGMTDCFRSGLAECDQRECSWRQYCLESADDGFQ